MRALILSLGLALLATPAAAQDADPAGGDTAPAADPVILRLAEDSAPPGSVVVLIGRSFGDEVDAVRATIDGKPCMVTEVTDTKIQLVSPIDAAHGKTAILLSVRGRKANAVPFTVLDPDTLDEEYWRKQTEKFESGERMEEDALRDKALTIDEVKEQTVDEQRIITVKGSLKGLFDGCRVLISVELGRTPIAQSLALVTKGSFECILGPFPKPLFPGRYRVFAAFIRAKQRYGIRQRFAKELNDEQKAFFNFIENQAFAELGGSADLAASERANLKGLIEETLSSYEETLADFQGLYAATLRCVFKDGAKLDERAWRNWLITNGFVRTQEDFDRISKDKRCIKGVHLDAAAWEAYVTELLAMLKARTEALTDYEARFLLLPVADAVSQHDSYVAIYRDLAWDRTVYLFKHYDLKVSRELLQAFREVPVLGALEGGVAYMEVFARKIRGEVQSELMPARPPEPELTPKPEAPPAPEAPAAPETNPQPETTDSPKKEEDP